MKHFSRGTRCLAAAAAMAASQVMAADTAPPGPPSSVPVERFFEPEQMAHPLISPGGDAVAVLIRSKAGRRQLAIIDTTDLHKINIAAAFLDADVVNVHWVNDKRLVYQSGQEDTAAADQHGSGLFAVDRDGGDMRRLIRTTWDKSETGSNIKSRELDPDNGLLRTLDDGSDDVMIEHAVFSSVSGVAGHGHVEVSGLTPLRLDTRSGQSHPAFSMRLPGHVNQWIFDGQGHFVMAAQRDGGVTSLLTLDGETWQTRATFPSYGPSPDSYNIWQVATDGRVYVTRYAGGPSSSQALYPLDLATFKPEKTPIVTLAGFDFDGDLIEDTHRHKVLGIHYESDAAGTAWLDPDLKKLQDKIDARLPGLVNTVDVADCGCASRVLVTSYSDRQPAAYFLYDRTDDNLIALGGERPAISARQMAMTDFFRIPARDGHEIPVYVTRPQGKGPWPTVVLVHGGPNMRGWHWRWDPESQFLASRGYLVVKPEFRGSDGYGERLYTSGFKQWGLTSQDDIADATTWAARQGFADAKRVCIAGASYGGYATLMGLVRYGDLYRCGVAWSAVADIAMMYDLWWSDAGNEWKGYGMPTMVGDPVKDAAQFVQTSPLKQAALIKRPLLLAHGGVDERVPIEQATAMRDALKDNHAPLTWIEYADEAHGWYKPENRFDFYTKMEAFLAANIGPGVDVSKP